jgi:hypothetical protein
MCAEALPWKCHRSLIADASSRADGTSTRSSRHAKPVRAACPSSRASREERVIYDGGSSFARRAYSCRLAAQQQYVAGHRREPGLLPLGDEAANDADRLCVSAPRPGAAPPSPARRASPRRFQREEPGGSETSSRPRPVSTMTSGRRRGLADLEGTGRAEPQQPRHRRARARQREPLHRSTRRRSRSREARPRRPAPRSRPEPPPASRPARARRAHERTHRLLQLRGGPPAAASDSPPPAARRRRSTRSGSSDRQRSGALSKPGVSGQADGLSRGETPRSTAAAPLPARVSDRLLMLAHALDREAACVATSARKLLVLAR